jgi:hypothetical protein
MRVPRHFHPHFDSPGHNDAAETMFFERALTYVEAQLLYRLIPPLEGRQFVATAPLEPIGTKRTEYRMITQVGRAMLDTDTGDDAQTSTFYTETFGHNYFAIKGSYQYTYDELMAAQLASQNSAAMGGPPINIDMESALAARQAIAQTLDTICAFGTGAVPTGVLSVGPDVGMLGLLNQPYASAYTIPNGAAGSPLWSLKTPDEVVADLTGIVAFQINSTFKVHSPKRIIVAVDSYQAQLAGRRMADGSDETILSFFQRTRKETEQPVEVRSWQMMSGAGSGATNLMLAYDPDERMVCLKMSQEFTQLQVEYSRETYRIPCRAKTAGIIARYPLSMTTSYGY